MSTSHDDIRELKILLVEDNFLIAEVLRAFLVECGCEVVGPAPRVERALELVEQNALDGAILDINLNGRPCFPIAAALAARSVPFVFLTGYDDPALISAEFQGAVRLAKPLDQAEVVAVAARLFKTGAH